MGIITRRYLTTSSYNLSNGGYNIASSPACPSTSAKWIRLDFTIGSNNAPEQIQPSLWNFQTKDMDSPSPLTPYDTNIPEAWQYVGMDGEILLNIKGDPNNYFDITSVDFTLMVQP